MRLTLRQLEIFLATAREQSVSRAAGSLALSQSAASAALGELERQYGVRLFDRVGKRVQLNDLGQALMPRAAELLDRARELESLLQQSEVAGALRVGATLTIGNYLGAQIISDYMQRYPRAHVTLAVENTAHIIARVAGFELDLGLVEGSCQHPDVEAIPWGRDGLEVFAAPDHPLARKRRITPADLAQADWILREPGSGTRETFDRAASAALGQVRVRLELAHTEAILQAVKAGLGIGCVSHIALAAPLAAGTIVRLKTPFLSLQRDFLIVVRRGKYLSAASRHFIALCQQRQPGLSGRRSDPPPPPARR
ncbi:MAG: LysR family transcriptional regulator [Steroidobacteraceae bacterium]